MNALNVTTVYQELMALIADPKSGFRSRSYPLTNGNVAEVIDYTLSSFQYFKKPSGMIGRGIMFEVTPDGVPVKILSRPMKKFFSYDECPDTMRLDMSADKILRIADKADGSLMSTWLDQENLGIKSKGSIVSVEVKRVAALLASDRISPNKQASDAMSTILGLPPQPTAEPQQYTYQQLAKVLHAITAKGYTVDMEYLCPESPIVIQYEEDELRILSINANDSEAEYSPEAALDAGIVTNDEYLVLKAFQAYPYFDQTCLGTEVEEKLVAMGFDSFLEKLQEVKGIEGVVIELKPGQSATRVKFKTRKYLTHTQALNSLSYDSRFPDRVYILRDPFAVFAAIAEGYADDLVHAVRNCEPLAIAVRDMQNALTPFFNEMQSSILQFVKENATLEKRDFAAKSRETFPPALASAAMQTLIHGHLDLISVLRKNKQLLPDLSCYQVSKKDYPDQN